MLATLRSCGVPAGFFNAISGMYFMVTVWATIRGQAFFAFLVQSGVLQGCPLSGTLFVISFDRVPVCVRVCTSRSKKLRGETPEAL